MKYMVRKSNAVIEVQEQPLGFKVKAPDTTSFQNVQAMIRDLLEHIAPGSEESVQVASSS